ncbi:succinate dehydrogenase assembly factor 2 [Phenylobacterium aquaticum]|uniref:succinate dehydrogenase assembly factor 2 n=1 Tax=Phenylobacterium aquaticum TaxID=1763816 RepID=UPI0026EE0851|nr:succinate dehydrogenase assembly factor 2 [Phenylobacterium aquaticum]
MTHDDTRLRRLKFRAWHRGFREADLILGPFADRYAHTLTDAQLDRIEALFEQPDHDIYEWIVERVPTPSEFDNDIMSMIKLFRFEAYEARGDDHGG